MKNDIPIEQLLRWRLARAEDEAPPAPRTAHLLEQIRPWWETWPEQFRSLVERLSSVQVAYGHAMTEQSRARTGYPVAAVVVHAREEQETAVRVLYLNLRDHRFCFRFQLNAQIQPAPENFEVTFISEANMTPVLTGHAARSVDSEYRIDMEVPEELTQQWGALKVTDRMPFRLILRSTSAISGI